MKAIKTLWFSGLAGHVGIVLGKLDTGSPAAHIAAVPGHNLSDDVNHITQYGGKVTLEDARELVKHLEQTVAEEDCSSL